MDFKIMLRPTMDEDNRIAAQLHSVVQDARMEKNEIDPPPYAIR